MGVDIQTRTTDKEQESSKFEFVLGHKFPVEIQIILFSIQRNIEIQELFHFFS